MRDNVLMNLHKLSNDTSYTPRVIPAHTSGVTALALNSSSSILATASERGTLIRIFLTAGVCEKIAEFRRGSDKADIYSLAFSFDSTFLCVGSDKGTVHVYRTHAVKPNRMSVIQQAFNDTSGDLCNFPVVGDHMFMCTFSDPNHVIVISYNGTFHKYIFNAEGKCKREEYNLFADDVDGSDF